MSSSIDCIQPTLQRLIEEPTHIGPYEPGRFEWYARAFVRAISENPKWETMLCVYGEFTSRRTNTGDYRATRQRALRSVTDIETSEGMPTNLAELLELPQVLHWCCDVERIDRTIRDAIKNELTPRAIVGKSADAGLKHVSDGTTSLKYVPVDTVSVLDDWRESLDEIGLDGAECHADGMRYLWLISQGNQLTALERTQLIWELRIAAPQPLGEVIFLPTAAEKIQAAAKWFSKEMCAKQTDPLDPLTPMQRAIMKALDGRALKADALAKEVAGGDRRRLYKKGGIKELRENDRVVNKRPLGYYRPDRPPEED
jgi:hypothetical protein